MWLKWLRILCNGGPRHWNNQKGSQFSEYFTNITFTSCVLLQGSDHLAHARNHSCRRSTTRPAGIRVT
jgi:hypothetical protein